MFATKRTPPTHSLQYVKEVDSPHLALVLRNLQKYPPVDVTFGDDMSDAEIKLSETVSIQVGTYSPYALLNVTDGDSIIMTEPRDIIHTHEMDKLLKDIEFYFKK